MGRKRQGGVLDVYVGSSKVGRYSRAPSGATAFRYDLDWLSSDRAFPISLSMPLSDRIWSGEAATSYFDGLLPDDHAVRERIATREHAESAGIFDLLAAIGRDCVGALQFVPEGLDPGDPATMEYRPVTDNEIAARIASLATHPLGLRADEDDFRTSKELQMNIDDMELYLKAKRQQKIGRVITAVAFLFITLCVVLLFLGVSRKFVEPIVIGVFIGALWSNNGTLGWWNVSKNQLIEVIEHQINSDSGAIKYLSKEAKDNG